MGEETRPSIFMYFTIMWVCDFAPFLQCFTLFKTTTKHPRRVILQSFTSLMHLKVYSKQYSGSVSTVVLLHDAPGKRLQLNKSHSQVSCLFYCLLSMQLLVPSCSLLSLPWQKDSDLLKVIFHSAFQNRTLSSQGDEGFFICLGQGLSILYSSGCPRLWSISQTGTTELFFHMSVLVFFLI